MWPFRRRRRREAPISEAEAYERLHGHRADVRIVELEQRRPRMPLRGTGEQLRKSFEQRLQGRGKP